MSDRIRRMILARQNALMAMAQMQMLNMNSNMPIQEQMAPAEGAPLEEQEQSIARQIMERYMAMKARTIQEELSKDERGALMAPMISSVMQLDR